MSQSIQATVCLNVLRGHKIQVLCRTLQGQDLKLSGPASHPVLASLRLGDSIRILARDRKWQRIERQTSPPASVDLLVEIASNLALQLLRQCQILELEREFQLSLSENR